MRLELEYSELELLAWAVPNEVINGFTIENFQAQIGISEQDFKKKAEHLREIPIDEQATSIERDAQEFRNALSLTLDELGLDEFQTRTGVDFKVGLQLLDK